MVAVDPLRRARATGPGALPHLGWPLLALGLLFLLCRLGGLDTLLADQVYQLQGGTWALRRHWLTEVLLHRGARSLAWGLWLVTVGTALWLRGRPGRETAAAAVACLAVTLPLGPLLVAALKGALPVACPWDLARYGGVLPATGVLPGGVFPARGGCFPAGHASAGYAWVACYFAAFRAAPAWRWHALALGFAAGVMLGVAQQLRGAHFVSHDIAALAVCWGVAYGVDHAWWRGGHGAAVASRSAPDTSAGGTSSARGAVQATYDA